MRSRVVVVAGCLLGVGLIVTIVSAVIETDEERIEQQVEDMRVAALEGDVAGVLAGFAEDFETRGGLPSLRRQIETTLTRSPPSSISAEVTKVEIEDDRAEVDIEVWYRPREAGTPARVRFHTVFGRRGERWLMTRLVDYEAF